jgi:uncharacterized membrane protein
MLNLFHGDEARKVMLMIRLPSVLTLTLTLSLLLAACAPAGAPEAPGEAPAPSRAYLALGTEPGWTLEITPARLNYAGDYGETRIAAPNPGARPSFNGERYVADRLTVDVTHAECSDGMSDRRYRDTVTVTADGKTVKGCGGAILPPAELAGTSWTFVSIGGAPVATLMACPGAAMEQERAFFALVKAPVRIAFPADGTMVLTGADGMTAVLKRAI